MELRLVNNLEVNKEIESLPDNVYGYIYGHTVANSIFKKDFKKLMINKRQPNDYEKSNLVFKLKKLNLDDIRLVGYISNEAMLTYNNLGGFSDIEIMVFPSPFKEFSNEIDIQLLKEPLSILDRNIEDDSSGQIGILEIKKCFDDNSNLKIKEISKIIEVEKAPAHQSQKDSFIKQLILHKNWSLLFIFLIIFVIYLIFGVSPKDLIPSE